MAIISTLNTIFTADVTRFDKGVGKAQGSASRFTTSIKTMGTSMSSSLVPGGHFGSMLSSFGPLAAAAGAGVIFVQRNIERLTTTVKVAGGAFAFWLDKMDSAFESLDKIAKGAARTGTRINAFADLQVGAELAGANADQLGKSMQRMQRSIVDVRFGRSAALTDTFDRLGISVGQLQGMKADQQFRLIGSAIGELGDDAMQSAAAMEIFGRTGGELIPMFEDGFKSVDDVTASMERFGVKIRESGVGSVEAFNDKMTVLSTVSDRFWQSMASDLAPVALAGLKTMEGVLASIADIFGNNASAADHFVALLAGSAALLRGMEQTYGNIIGFINQIPGVDLDQMERGLKGGVLSQKVFDVAGQISKFEKEMDKALQARLQKEEQKRLAMEAKLGKASAFENLDKLNEWTREIRGLNAVATPEQWQTAFMSLGDVLGGAATGVASDFGAMFAHEAKRMLAPDVGALQRGTVAEFQARNSEDDSLKELRRTSDATEETSEGIRTLTSVVKSLKLGFGGV